MCCWTVKCLQLASELRVCAGRADARAPAPVVVVSFARLAMVLQPLLHAHILQRQQ
jgi:hypothetical protein